MLLAEQASKNSGYKALIAITDIAFHCSSIVLFQSLPNMWSIHFSPWFSLCAGTWFPSMLYLFSTLFLSLPKLCSLPLFALPYIAHTEKKSNYNTAKPIWEKQASHSVGEGGWNACRHQTSKLQYVKPRPVACPVQQWDHSSAMWANLIVQGTLL